MSNPPAIFVLANDRVFQNVARLFASLKRLGFENRLYIIPFNDELHYINAIKQDFGFETWDADYARIDRFGRRIYDRAPPADPYPYMLGKLRKLAWLQYPGPSVFLDADCIITSRPAIFNNVFDMRDNAIGFINTSPDGVYEDRTSSQDLRKRSKFITSGVLAKSNRTVDISDIESFFSEKMISLYLEVKKGGGYVDQPLWNFMIDNDFLSSRDLLEGQRIARATSPEEELKINPDCTMYDTVGRPVLLLHIAGNLKQTESFRFLRDAYVTAALSQCKSVDASMIGELFRYFETQDTGA